MDEQTVVVTGASGGLGRALATAFAEDGAAVVAGVRNGGDERARRSETETPAGETVADVDGVELVSADARDEYDAERLMERAARRGGAIDLLIPCAAVFHGAPGETPLTEESYAAFDDEYRTNARGVFAAIREAVPHLAPDARVLVPSAAAARESRPGYGGYAVSKAAAEAVARGFAADLDQAVGVVDPGAVATDPTDGEARDPAEAVGLFRWAATEAAPDEVNGLVLDSSTWERATGADS